jgi:hypothetical protein
VGTVSIDGTVIESAASRWTAIRAEAAKLQAEQAAAAAQAQPHDEQVAQQAQVADQLARVAAERCAARDQVGKNSATVQVTPSDIEAVVRPRKDGAMRPAYKASSLMHESGVLLGQHVDPTSETAAVRPLLEQHQALMGADPAALLMDAGYHSGPLLGELAEQEINVLCPSGQTLSDGRRRGPKVDTRKPPFDMTSSSMPISARLITGSIGEDEARTERAGPITFIAPMNVLSAPCARLVRPAVTDAASNDTRVMNSRK